MTITIRVDCGSTRRAYRIECPDDARIYTDPADSRETILIPDPEHRKHPERSAWLRLDDALVAVREGRHGLRLIAEEELPLVGLVEGECARKLHPDPTSRPIVRRRSLALVMIGVVACAAGPVPVVAGVPGDSRFPVTIAAEIGGRPVRLALTGTALRTKYLARVYAVASYAQEGAMISDAESLATLDIPKQLHLIFERDVDGATMAKGFRESIGRSHPAPAFGTELGMLERNFVANPVRQGDHIRLTHIPGVGLGVQVNAGPGMVIRGVGFSRAAWGTYLGPNHLGVALRDGLTSRLR